MTPLTASEAEAWLAAYGRAWADGDADAVLRLFTPHAEYRETPFDPPMVGHAAIRRYWQEGAAEGQHDVRFGFTLWSVQGAEAYAHWTASFTRAATGEPVRLDGAFALAFARAPEGTPLCTTLREWWHRA
jgi:ketosteroid isomerase-like protein